MTDTAIGSGSAGPMVWLNGSVINQTMARIDPSDRGFTLGDGLYETIAVQAGAALRLSAHFARLRRGAEILGLPVPYCDAVLAKAVGQVIAANDLAMAVVRLTLTAGIGPRGVARPNEMQPTMLLTAAHHEPPPATPVRLVVSRLYRRDETSPLSQVKSLNYLPSILARREATMRGAEDALLLNCRGRVAEATAANLFLRKGSNWITPPISDGALPGIMREVLLQEWAALEQPVTLACLAQADELALSTSLGVRTGILIEG